MSQAEQSVDSIPYARSLALGVPAATIYRIIGICGGLNAIGRLATPARFLGSSFTMFNSARLGVPHLDVVLSILVLLLALYSAIVLGIVAVGTLNGSSRLAGWLWTSEPAALLVILLVNGGSFFTYLQFRTTLGTGFWAAYVLTIFSSVSLPIAWLLLLRAARSAEGRQDHHA